MGVQLNTFKNTRVLYEVGKLWEGQMKLGAQRQKCSDVNKPYDCWRGDLPSVVYMDDGGW